MYSSILSVTVTSKTATLPLLPFTTQAFLPPSQELLSHHRHGLWESMTYVVPIFDDLLRHPEIKGGVRATLVYLMNALTIS